ncbi:MAG TPA: hypothetical protein VM557_02040 [Thermoanaerobaculia bacterium]|nr:hypothetical protein [Thermoanaerobaculia bacterium]
MTDEELRRQFDSMRQDNASDHGETRRYFDVAVERMAARFNGLAESVALLDSKLERTASVLEKKIEGLPPRRRR